MANAQDALTRAFLDSLAELDKVIAKVPKEGLDWAEKEGEWTIREVLHHVTEDCNVYVFIIEQALATPGCTYVFGDAPENQVWGRLLGWQERPVEAALALIHAHRVYLAELVGHFPDRRENEIHFANQKGETLGTRNVAQMVVMLTDHMKEHTAMIQQIVAAHAA